MIGTLGLQETPEQQQIALKRIQESSAAMHWIVSVAFIRILLFVNQLDITYRGRHRPASLAEERHDGDVIEGTGIEGDESNFDVK